MALKGKDHLLLGHTGVVAETWECISAQRSRLIAKFCIRPKSDAGQGQP
jgi:hypothetical protein